MPRTIRKLIIENPRSKSPLEVMSQNGNWGIHRDTHHFCSQSVAQVWTHLSVKEAGRTSPAGELGTH